MKTSRIVAFLLAMSLCVMLLSGCESLSNLKSRMNQPHPYSEAFQRMDPEEIIADLTGTDISITWHQLFHWIYKATETYETNNGAITDFNEMLETGVTVGDYILSQAVSSALEYAYLEAGAGSLGVSITDGIRKSVEDQMKKEAEYFDSYEDYVDAIENEYSTYEYYVYTREISALYSALYFSLYGENGSMLEDQKVLDYVKDDGYLMAKQIQFNLYDPNTGKALDEEGRAKKMETAQWALKQINACGTQEEKLEKFDFIVNRYSEDVSKTVFQEGYLFTPFDMPTEYVEEVEKLEEYEYSDVLTINDTLFIILRLPINPDVIPMAHMNLTSSTDYTLRYMVSVYLYNDTVKSWPTEFPAIFTEAYEKIDVAELLGEN